MAPDGTMAMPTPARTKLIMVANWVTVATWLKRVSRCGGGAVDDPACAGFVWQRYQWKFANSVSVTDDRLALFVSGCDRGSMT